MKYLKLFGLITIIEAVAWLLFVFADFIDEFTFRSPFGNIAFTIVFLLIFLIPILYLKFEKKICKKLDLSKLKLFFISIIIYLIETLSLGIYIIYLVRDNCFIIKQDTSGFFNLNGLEYLFYLVALSIIPIATIIIIKLIIYIYRLLKRVINNI